MEQGTQLNEAQLSILRLLGRMKTVEQVNELRQVISSYYAKKATELVQMAISRVPAGNDYIIIDRCAGTGNLEMYLDDGVEDVLSHCILSTYELKEWMVLKDRFGSRVRYIVPPIPKDP